MVAVRNEINGCLSFRGFAKIQNSEIQGRLFFVTSFKESKCQFFWAYLKTLVSAFLKIRFAIEKRLRTFTGMRNKDIFSAKKFMLTLQLNHSNLTLTELWRQKCTILSQFFKNLCFVCVL